MEYRYLILYFIYLNTAAPLVHQSIQPDLKQLVVSQRSMGHHHPVIELVQRSFPLRRPTVVAQFDQRSVALMEANFAVVVSASTTTSGRHSAAAASSVVERQRVVVVVLANEETGSGSDGDAG